MKTENLDEALDHIRDFFGQEIRERDEERRMFPKSDRHYEGEVLSLTGKVLLVFMLTRHRKDDAIHFGDNFWHLSSYSTPNYIEELKIGYE